MENRRYLPNKQKTIGGKKLFWLINLVINFGLPNFKTAYWNGLFKMKIRREKHECQKLKYRKYTTAWHNRKLYVQYSGWFFGRVPPKNILQEILTLRTFSMGFTVLSDTFLIGRTSKKTLHVQNICQRNTNPQKIIPHNVFKI